MTHTFTRTHVHVTFANPYLACTRCTSWVTGYHDPERCGCDAGWWNVPCEHDYAVFSACPSWGPVDGCSCREHLGQVVHGEPSVMVCDGCDETFPEQKLTATGDGRSLLCPVCHREADTNPQT